MEIKSRHECYYCNKTFEWQYTKPDTSVVFVLSGAEANIYAKGRNNNRVVYEVVATCPKCKIKNKFDYEK